MPAVLAQVTNGLLEGQPGNVRAVAGAVGALLAAAAVHYSSNARTLRAAFPLYVVGLAVAAATGFALGGVLGAAFAASLFLVGASVWETYDINRSPSEVGLWALLAGVGVVALFVISDAKTTAFIAASVIIVYAALRVLKTDVLVHATIWLAAVLIGVAAIYLSLGAEFLALIQVLIYVGAVVTLFLFTVMLTIPEEEAHGLDQLELPPGVTIESVVDLEAATPAFGTGPYKGFQDTNPRKPTREPTTLYGVSIADGVYGDERTVRKGEKKKEA